MDIRIKAHFEKGEAHKARREWETAWSELTTATTMIEILEIVMQCEDDQS